MAIRSLLSAALLLPVLAACGAGSASPSAPAVTPSPTPQGIVHPTAAGEIVLRFDEGGGFVPVEFFAAHVPSFTLYGDGTVVFVRTSASAESAPNGPSTGQPLRTARLAEPQIQELLTFALSEGGLAIARDHYDNPGIADAPTAVFELHAAGDVRRVSVYALGLDTQPGADSAVKAALGRLASRLRDFDAGGALSSAPYVATAYRGVITDAGGGQGVAIRPWPWPSITPSDFRLPADPNAFQQLSRTMTPADAAVLGVEGFENGITGGLWLRAPDDRVYSFVLRPLLPDEQA